MRRLIAAVASVAVVFTAPAVPAQAQVLSDQTSVSSEETSGSLSESSLSGTGTEDLVLSLALGGSAAAAGAWWLATFPPQLPFPLPFPAPAPAPAPNPAPAPKPAPAPRAPQYGDACSASQAGQVFERRLACVYTGHGNYTWVYVAPEALNPDGTLRPGAGG